VNVIVPLAGVRVAGLGADVSMMLAVGFGAVPVSDALSVTGSPRVTSAPAVVVNVGVTGFTVKHSVADESLEPVMLFAASPLKVALQQYRPAAVTQALGETTVTG
jgi:hypothetical protein